MKKKLSKKGWCFKTAKELRRKATKAELVLRTKLLDAGIYRHRFQRHFITEEGIIYIADFYIRRKRIIIEVDGGYHFDPLQIEKDTERDRYFLTRKDVRGILRLTNEQAFQLSPLKLKEIIDGIGKKECLIIY